MVNPKKKKRIYFVKEIYKFTASSAEINQNFFILQKTTR